MTSRSRDDAVRLVTKAVSNFKENKYPLIATTELRDKLANGERVIMVDVRLPEEIKTSMIPGAVTQSHFEAELLPVLKDRFTGDNHRGGDVESPPMVVPYCTVGYRSYQYCQELAEKHGITNVRNGEGVIMWAFDGGRLVRPVPDEAPQRAPALAPEVPAAVTPSAISRSRSTIEAWLCGRPRAEVAPLHETPKVVQQLHVFGKLWDCAPEGFETEYFPRTEGAAKYIRSKVRPMAAMRGSLWLFALLVFYLFFTPMCGLMYDCGCKVQASKWGQVKNCNVFNDEEESSSKVHKCPWCDCHGLACALVAFDTKAFREIPLLDMLPDGFLVGFMTIIVLRYAWRSIDRRQQRKAGSDTTASILKAVVVIAWFLGYSLVMGVLFFLMAPDYPRFLWIERGDG